MIRVDFSKLRFLVIDDNAHMRRIVRTLLHGFGARDVHEAEDGASGLEAFNRHAPDIVLTDWAMPIFDGLELTQMMRQPGANANPYVPIIMLTGHSEKKRVMAARDAGVTEFLAKPISAKALYQRILNIVVNPRPFVKAKSYFGPDRRRNANLNYVGPERRKGGKADDIKGQAATLGFPQVSTVAESLCRLIERVRDPERLPRELIDQHVDAVRAILREQVRPHAEEIATHLSRQLREVSDDFLRREGKPETSDQ